MSDEDLAEIQKEVFFPALKEAKKVQTLKRNLSKCRMEFFHQFEMGNMIYFAERGNDILKRARKIFKTQVDIRLRQYFAGHNGPMYNGLRRRRIE